MLYIKLFISFYKYIYIVNILIIYNRNVIQRTLKMEY